MNRNLALGLVLLSFVLGCGPGGEGALPGGRLDPAAKASRSWSKHGGDDAEQRYSQLDRIGEHNVAELGLAWSFDLGSERGVEATPLVADGVLYVTAPWSVVFALDAATGEQLWTYDPQVPRKHARKICCGVVNRGAALYGDKLFVGTLDARLIALDRATGEPIWDVATGDGDWPYSITGAPRVVAGNVVIGNAGADYGARGYVSAYDTNSGERVWRTYTVPGNPADGFESEAMRRAATTWSGEWWRSGGGGTVWDGMAFDPELDLLYVGTGNGSPHPAWLRSPGGGDNLYLSSILALRPATGELVWHYQTTPGDSWDYTATQPLVLADLEIEGRLRKVLLQVPKNGFFFVIDRETGEFLSADPIVPVTWATHYDEAGRPVLGNGDYRDAPQFIRPSPYGAHSWQPMSFHPGTGLVYLPVRDMGMLFKTQEPGDFKFVHGYWNTGLDSSVFDTTGSDDPTVSAGPEAQHDWSVSAALIAWDPVARREAWRVSHATAFNGGTLSTAGNLVFEGTADGRFVAYRATDGAKLWEAPVGTGVMAGPVSYEVAGDQYVAVAAGWGASFGMTGGAAALAAGVRGGGRVVAFKLGGEAELLPFKSPRGPVPAPEYELESSAAERHSGMVLFSAHCGVCHGPVAVGGGSGVPDLRYTTAVTHAGFSGIVLGGVLEPKGMPRFDDVLTPGEVRAIQAFILEQAELASHPAAGD